MNFMPTLATLTTLPQTLDGRCFIDKQFKITVSNDVVIDIRRVILQITDKKFKKNIKQQNNCCMDYRL